MISSNKQSNKPKHGLSAIETESSQFNGFHKNTFSFLKNLSFNNNRDWFNKHHDEYEKYYLKLSLMFIDALSSSMKKISPSVKCESRINGSLFRLQRDVRFAKDKTPYKDYLDMLFWHGEKKTFQSLSFFLRLAQKEIIIGAGILSFDSQTAAAYRHAVIDNAKGKALTQILKRILGAGPYHIGGQTRKKVPAGFDANHPRADLLLHDGLFVEYRGPLPNEVYNKDFVVWCANHYETVAPLYNWLLSM